MDYLEIFVWTMIGTSAMMSSWYAWMIVRNRRVIAKAKYITTRLPRLLANMCATEQSLCEYHSKMGDLDVAGRHWIRADMLKTMIEMLDRAYAIADSAPVAPKPPEPSKNDNRTSSLH